MIDTLRLTAEDALGLLERKEVSGSELHRAYLDAVNGRDERWSHTSGGSHNRRGFRAGRKPCFQRRRPTGTHA